MEKTIMPFVVAFIVLAFIIQILLFSVEMNSAEGQEPRGAVAVCNWANFTEWGHDGYNWRWWGCNLSLVGQHQCRGGPNTRLCYTVVEAKRDVRAFRAWTGLG